MSCLEATNGKRNFKIALQKLDSNFNNNVSSLSDAIQSGKRHCLNVTRKLKRLRIISPFKVKT